MALAIASPTAEHVEFVLRTKYHSCGGITMPMTIEFRPMGMLMLCRTSILQIEQIHQQYACSTQLNYLSFTLFPIFSHSSNFYTSNSIFYAAQCTMCYLRAWRHLLKICIMHRHGDVFNGQSRYFPHRLRTQNTNHTTHTHTQKPPQSYQSAH